MKKLVPPFFAVFFISFAAWGCSADGSKESKDILPTDSLSDIDVVEVPQVVELVWEELPGSELEGIKTFRDMVCRKGKIYVDVQRTTESGLFFAQASGGEFTRIYEGLGFLEPMELGVLVAKYGGANQTASLDLVGDNGIPQDLAFNFEQTEIKAMNYAGNFLFLLAKDWKTADYMIYRGNPALAQWETAGSKLNETGLSMYSTGDTIHLLTIMNEVTGIHCLQMAATAGPSEYWTPCPSLPELAKHKPSDLYSVKGEIFGAGSRMAAWFNAKMMGEDKGYLHYASTTPGNWQEIAGIPPFLPSAWLHAGDWYLLGSLGTGQERAYKVNPGAEETVEPFFTGLPASSHEKSGIVGFCVEDTVVYAGWLDFAITGSKLNVYRLDLSGNPFPVPGGDVNDVSGLD